MQKRSVDPILKTNIHGIHYMPLLRGTQLQHSIGQQIVLDNAEIQLDAGDRVCLLGRNGSAYIHLAAE